MSGFAVGRTVIAVEENSPLAKASGKAPVGNTVTCGLSGTLIEGPTPWFFLGEEMNYWHVEWRDGRHTWSGQKFLMLIEDPDATEGADTESPICEPGVLAS